MANQLFQSLRSRYLVLVVLLGSVVVTGAILGYRDLNRTTHDITADLAARNQLLEYSRSIRVTLFEGHKALYAFLLDPTRTELRQQVERLLYNTRLTTRSLLDHPWINSLQQTTRVRDLDNVLEHLEGDIQHLIETRLDPARQFPAMDTANQLVQPNRDIINNTFSVAIRETAAEVAEGRNVAVYYDITAARHLWSQMLSNFRMYLANRMGSFDEAALPVQANAVETMYLVLREQLADLRKYQREGRLGFETDLALDTLIASTDAWFSGFEKVRDIHASGEWRSDILIIRTTIEPRLNLISSLLNDLEIIIADATSSDMSTLSELASAQTRISWMAGAAGVLFILLILFSIDRLIFRPLKGLTRALQACAGGKDSIALPESPYSETRDLLHAFASMRKQVRERQNALQHQALHDSLTGLPNRTLLLDRLEQAIHHASRENGSFAFMIMDLDRFKEINDSLGHHVGDRLLHDVGTRLTHDLREVDTVARIGGDEFAILLSDGNLETTPLAADKIHQALVAPFEIGQLKCYVGGSIGIALYPQHGTDAQTLVQRADVAMYMAKKSKQRHCFYDPSQDEYTIDRLSLITDLRHALDEEQLELYFQPKIDIALNELVAAEALLRWRHPDHGDIPPEQIISLAEHTGLIEPITFWVLDRAISQCSRWQRTNRGIKVAVNLSAHAFRDTALVGRIRSYLEKHGLDAEQLILEITESAMMSDPAQALVILDQLDAMGLQLSIDDFGTGFSSLTYLKQLPVDELKIDKAFVLNLDKDGNDEMIVRSTIDLAHNLRLNVTAEGVANRESWEILAQLGCDTAQGNLISPPLPAAAFDNWLNSWAKTA